MNSTKQLVFGARVGPDTGENEVVENDRFVVYQDEFPELNPSVKPENVVCRLYAPIEHLAELRRTTSLEYDIDSFFPCLIMQSSTAEALKILQAVFPDLELLNADDDVVYEKFLSGQAKEIK